jgi:hypothetical protein
VAEAPTTLMGHILNQGLLLVAWVLWLVVVNSASIVFVRAHREARWVLAAWLVNFAVMSLLFERFGFVRLLGLAHVLVWTPLLVYLWRRLPDVRRNRGGGAFRAWLGALMVSNAISLVIDYVDVVRYLAGDGSLPG